MQRQLDGGLILRSLSEGFESDRANVSKFYQETFGEAGEDDTVAMGAWVDTLVSGTHPTTTLDDVWVVVDPSKNDQIVSAVLLIPQDWQYEGIPVGVGRVELVATNKDYRRRGLVRAQIEAAHERSASLGHIMQSITGIGHYYRRFGYTMAVDLGIRNTLPFYAVPKLAKDEQPKYTFRMAALEDADRLTAWDQYRARTSRLSMVRTPDQWRFEIAGRRDNEVWKLYIHIIVNHQGEDVGYFAMRLANEFQFCACQSYVVGDQASYLDTWSDVTRQMKAHAEEYYQDKPDLMPGAIYFDSGMPEAIDAIVQATPGGRSLTNLYAWYLRVADLSIFIRQIAPVLEQRLKGSGANNYTGSLKIGYYDLTGLEITFEQGKIVDAVQRPFVLYEGDVSFPFHSFLNVLFGHRTWTELDYIYPEAGANAKARVLLDALFPKQRSWINGLA